jgi:hypothetical protein
LQRAEAIDVPPVSSIANIAPFRDVAVTGQRNRGAVGAIQPAQGSAAATPEGSKSTPEPGDPTKLGAKQLSPDQVRLVQDLAQIDEKVRAHEAAHQAAAGSLGGAVSFTYETGPDGKSYAVGGEVPVDMSSGRTPEETLSRAAQIRAAALAPADPSPQDLSVAAEASQMEAAARAQLMQQQLAALHANKAGHAGQSAVLGPQTPRGKEDSGTTGATVASSSVDAGTQAAATLATLQSDRSAAGTTSVQVQQLARLAMAAYGL